MQAMSREDGYLPIADYGAIGDCRSLALVGVDGSIDWCCLPRFDSPSIFGRLLDQRDGGSWELAPVDPHSSRQQYSDKTNILQTVFQTSDGLAVVTDFMPADERHIRRDARPDRHPRLIRVVTGLAGSVRFSQRIDMRPDFGNMPNPLTPHAQGLHADDGRNHYCISATIPLEAGRQTFTVNPGDTIAMALALNHTATCGHPITLEQARRLLRVTREYWWTWISRCTYQGPYQVHVWRSALTLKLLTYAPTGAIVAAPTTSLPEWIGGERNWDYRYTWLRDASFTLYSLFQLGYRDEARDFMEWLGRVAVDRGLQNLYDLDGRVPADEQVLNRLSGYRGSRPVRVGNGAAAQLQLDIFGELLDCAYLFVAHGGQLSDALWKELSTIVNFAVERWQEPDASVWEVRGQNLHFTYSKAMCWVAVDRGLRLAEKLGKPAGQDWGEAHRSIHAAVVDRGYSKNLGSFTQSFDSEELDAAALRLIQLGFLDERDPRLRSTIDAIDEHLSSGPLVFRYRTGATDDGMKSPEGSFIICAFWLADALALVGDLEEAERRFERLLAFASPLGLFAEEVDSRSGALLGNFPQAFSHLSLISAAVNIERCRAGKLKRVRRRRNGKPQLNP